MNKKNPEKASEVEEKKIKSDLELDMVTSRVSKEVKEEITGVAMAKSLLATSSDSTKCLPKTNLDNILNIERGPTLTDDDIKALQNTIESAMEQQRLEIESKMKGKIDKSILINFLMLVVAIIAVLIAIFK